ncbi:MAG: pyrroloquinoline quinone biosynthesis protein PqqB [Pseudomonadota bacterium]|nr:pyrroloquinoline quinone biosynthesis protein PqqB [Pseudomonadota bacterium]
MELIVLGAAAGGGLPQWNCAGGQSVQVWNEARPPQSQASVAIGDKLNGYIVINASPDLRQQILQTPQLHPKSDHPEGVRNTPIKVVIVTNADVDNVAGLLNLREKQAFRIYGPTKVLEILQDNAIFTVLDPEFVKQCPLETSETINPIAGVEIELFTVAGKAPLYLEDSLGIQSGDLGFTSGIEIRTEAGKTLVISSCAQIDQKLRERIETADHLLFDGTVFEDDEMPQLGLGEKTGRRMGHLPISGPDGPLAQLAHCKLKTKRFFHINNSNPIWDEQSPAYQTIRDAGWDICHDGLVLEI